MSYPKHEDIALLFWDFYGQCPTHVGVSILCHSNVSSNVLLITHGILFMFIPLSFSLNILDSNRCGRVSARAPLLVEPSVVVQFCLLIGAVVSYSMDKCHSYGWEKVRWNGAPSASRRAHSVLGRMVLNSATNRDSMDHRPLLCGAYKWREIEPWKTMMKLLRLRYCNVDTNRLNDLCIHLCIQASATI